MAFLFKFQAAANFVLSLAKAQAIQEKQINCIAHVLFEIETYYFLEYKTKHVLCISIYWCLLFQHQLSQSSAFKTSKSAEFSGFADVGRGRTETEEWFRA